MEAKDTVISDKEIKVIFDRAKRTPTSPVDCYVCRVNLTKAQTEISFKAGQEEERERIVEELEHLNANKIVEGHPVLEFVIGWQALRSGA